MPTEISIRCYGVSVFVLRNRARSVEVLLLHRAASGNGQWCQVAGGIERGETAVRAALREMHEETALAPDTLYSADILEQFYEVAKDSVWIAPVFVAFVKPDARVVLNHEHTAHRWLPFRTAIAMVPFPGQKEILRKVHAVFVRGKPPEVLRIKVGNRFRP